MYFFYIGSPKTSKTTQQSPPVFSVVRDYQHLVFSLYQILIYVLTFYSCHLQLGHNLVEGGLHL